MGGTAGELLDTLRRICTDARMTANDLPYDVRAVGRQVREIAPPAAQSRHRHPGQGDAADADVVEIRPRLAQ